MLTEFFKALGAGYNAPNAGGCGLFAYAASRALDSIGIENKIIVCCWNSDSVYRFSEVYGQVKKSVDRHYNDHLSNNKTHHVLHNHIVVKVGNNYFDAEGMDNSVKTAKLKAELSIGVLKQLVQTRREWNNKFWSRNNPNKTRLNVVAARAEKLAEKFVAINNKAV